MKKTKFENQWNIIVPQAIERFSKNVARINKKNPKYYEESPDSWLKVKDYGDRFEYVFNDEYWSKHWSCFLLTELICEIYKKKPKD